MDYMFFHEDVIINIPKDDVSVIKIDREIAHREIIVPSMVIEYLINEANHHWIIDWCICHQLLPVKFIH